MVEAVVGFRFQRDPSTWDSVYYGRIHVALQKDFPLVETLTGPTLTLTAGEQTQVLIASEVKRFTRSDHGVVVSVAPDFLGVSVLPPHIAGGHPGWAFLRDTAIYVLETYRRVTTPSALTQVGVRYINVVPIQVDAFRLRDYLRPDGGVVPEVLAEERKPFALRVERIRTATESFHQREVVGLTARATPEGGAQLILDVDELLLLNPGSDLDVMENSMDTLNVAVHDVFEGVIAEHVLESFGPIPTQTAEG